METEAQAKWMQLCGVPKRYRLPLLETLAGREQIEAYCDLLSENCERGRGLLLVGGIVSGKTMGLAYIVSRARTALPGSSMVVMATAWRVFQRLYQNPENLEALARVDLLLIDDLGGEYRADWGFERFEALVEHRYAEELPTCVATKLTMDELEDSLIMARIMSRWREVLEVVELPDAVRRDKTVAERRAPLIEAGYLKGDRT